MRCADIDKISDRTCYEANIFDQRQDPKYGTVYSVTTTAEMMEMAKRENLLLFMPHPRTKGSAGYPDAIRNAAFFRDPAYRGAGFRWGMGLDGSETRMCEFRCLPLLDDMNNWIPGDHRAGRDDRSVADADSLGKEGAGADPDITADVGDLVGGTLIRLREDLRIIRTLWKPVAAAAEGKGMAAQEIGGVFARADHDIRGDGAVAADFR